MPGVVVTTAVRTGPTNEPVAPGSPFFLVGTAVRGPIDEAKAVNSITEFEALYGGYDSNFSLHPHVQTYFEEGGARCYVARVVGASATAGTLVLDDTSAADALTINAANPGVWSSGVSIRVDAGSGGGFNVRVLLDDVVKYSTGEVTTVDEAVAKLSNSSVAKILVTATAIDGGAALDVVDATPLSAGVAGSAPTASAYTDALALFEDALGAGAVAIPGQGVDVHADLVAHAVANNRIALLAVAAGEDDTDAVSAGQDVTDEVGAESAALYYPHVIVPAAGGVDLTISPESFVAAKRSLAHNEVGPWSPVAGLVTSARFVKGLATPVNRTLGNSLDEDRVNALRIIDGSVRIYGARSLSDDEDNFRFITIQDTLNYVVAEAERRLEDLTFATIDGRKAIYARIESTLLALLEPMRAAGGLFEAFDANGEQVDPGYAVRVTDTLNPLEQLATGRVRASVGIRPTGVSDIIEVEVIKSNLTSSVV